MTADCTSPLPRFKLPSISEPTNEWGPSEEYQPEQFKDIPYAPFSKSDRLGKVADWSSEGQNRLQHENRRQNRRDQAYGAGAENPFAYQHTADDSSFSIVDSRVTKKTTFSRGFVRTAPRTLARGGSFQRFDSTRGRGGFQNRRRFGWKDYDRQRNRDASILIGPDWTIVEEIELNRIAKLTHKIGEPKDLSFHGQLCYYDKKYDRPSPSEGMLKQIETIKYNTTTSEDPIMQIYTKTSEATVFFTDSVLALLMCSPRSVAPWDIIVNRIGDKVFFDKRDGGPLDTITVNENASDPPTENPADKDNINSPSNLSVEALYVNQNYQAQVLDYSQTKHMAKPNPFHDSEEAEGEILGSCAYRYRMFPLSDTINMIVRTEIDAIQKGADGSESYVLVRALNEFDSKAAGSGGAIDWRTKLDSQRGAVVATEMKNNNCKLARWAVQAILAGAAQLKLGWVSRAHPKENRRHQILTTMQYRPQDFVSQMNFQLSTGWGIVHTIVRLCLQLEEGHYMMVKDPNKPIIRLYNIPGDDLEVDLDNDIPLEVDLPEVMV
ncbi:hypothetical protein DSO57_1005680 [Entomophthora muscae]|uniref:Uncharacterized protein n=1 Tax=Entomophthora muscae TaxID=34485 RepID=A0ACC2RYZ8_9FUNG|nr:hypothetical protein DSO57_1005680 [Entomophthora muscae]